MQRYQVLQSRGGTASVVVQLLLLGMEIVSGDWHQRMIQMIADRPSSALCLAAPSTARTCAPISAVTGGGVPVRP